MYIRHVYIKTLLDKMAISRGGHLFAIAVILICGLASAYDYTSSRQFRKNLGVSKYRNDTYWLSNYTWRPPEKYYGPRKKPAWEVAEEGEEVQEDDAKSKQLKEWEEKMREVSRKEREKWKTYNKGQENATPDNQGSGINEELKKSDESIVVSLSSTEKNDENYQNSGTESLDHVEERGSHITTHSGNNEMLGVSNEEVSTESSESRDKCLKKEHQDGKLKHTIFSHKIVKPLIPHVRMLESKTQKSAENSRHVKDDKKLHDHHVVKGKHQKHANERSGDSNRKKKEHLKNNHVEEGENTDLIFPQNRWGMSHKDPPANFLKDVSKNAKGQVIDSATSNQQTLKKQRKSTDHQGFVSVQKIKSKTVKQKKDLGPEEKRWDTSRTVADDKRKSSRIKGNRKQPGRKKPKAKEAEEHFRSNRWGMSVTSTPHKFLEDISEGSSRQNSGTDGYDAYGNTRWGMSITSPPQLFVQDISRRSNSPKAGISEAPENTRWGMSMSTPPEEFFEDISKHRRTQRPSSRSQKVGTIFDPDAQLEQEIIRSIDGLQTKIPKQIHQRHNDVFDEIDSRETLLKRGQDQAEDYEDRSREVEEMAAAEENEIEDVQTIRSEFRNMERDAGDDNNLFRSGGWQVNVTSPAEELPSDLPAGKEKFRRSRWGMSISEPPDKFLQDISKSRRMGDHESAKSSSTTNFGSIPRDYHVANPRNTGTTVPNLPGKHDKATDNAAVSREDLCKSFTSQHTDPESIPEICREWGKANPRLKMNHSGRPWADENGKVDANNVYVQRGLSILLNMMQQRIDPGSKFISVPVICRVERVPIETGHS